MSEKLHDWVRKQISQTWDDRVLFLSMTMMRDLMDPQMTLENFQNFYPGGKNIFLKFQKHVKSGKFTKARLNSNFNSENMQNQMPNFPNPDMQYSQYPQFGFQSNFHSNMGNFQPGNFCYNHYMPQMNPQMYQYYPAFFTPQRKMKLVGSSFTILADGNDDVSSSFDEDHHHHYARPHFHHRNHRRHFAHSRRHHPPKHRHHKPHRDEYDYDYDYDYNNDYSSSTEEMENQNIEKDEEEAKAESSQYEIDEEDENGELANSKSESDEEPKMINVTFNEDDDEETKDDPDHVNIIFDEDSDGNIQVVIPEWVTNATSEKVAKDQYFELEFSFDDVVEIEFIEDVQTKQLTIEVPDIVKKICEKELDPQPDELEFGFHLEDDDQIEIEFYEDENENVTEIIIPESMKDLKKGINNNKPKESKKSYIGENEQIEIELSFSDIEFSDSTEYSYEDETTIVEYKDYFVNGKHTKREVIMNTNNDDLQIDMNSTILIDLEEIRRSVLNSKQ